MKELILWNFMNKDKGVSIELVIKLKRSKVKLSSKKKHTEIRNTLSLSLPIFKLVNKNNESQQIFIIFTNFKIQLY